MSKALGGKILTTKIERIKLKDSNSSDGWEKKTSRRKLSQIRFVNMRPGLVLTLHISSVLISLDYTCTFQFKMFCCFQFHQDGVIVNRMFLINICRTARQAIEKAMMAGEGRRSAGPSLQRSFVEHQQYVSPLLAV